MFLYSKWLELDLPTRIKLADDFGIQKKNSTHVADNQVVSDGYVIQDIEAALNIDALQKYLSTNETDMAILWDMLIYPTKDVKPEEILTPVVEGEEIKVVASKDDGVLTHEISTESEELSANEPTNETEKSSK